MVLHPVGPLPASTYWRRRLALLVALVAVLLVARSCVGGGADRTGTTATPTPTTASSSPTPRPTATVAAGPVTCRDRALTLTASTDAPQYAEGATPRITLTIKNVSKSSCRRDLGDGMLEVLVYSGADRIWSSDDCATNKRVAVQTLHGGASLQTTKRGTASGPRRGAQARRPRPDRAPTRSVPTSGPCSRR